MNLSAATDEELVSLALSGRDAAFTVLMQRHKAWLFRFVSRYVADIEDAREIVQESFASAWQALARYDPNRRFSIWLRRIALNKCRDRGRRIAVRGLFRPLDRYFEEQAPADPSTGPDETLMRKELARLVRNAVDSLPRQLKEALLLTALECLSHAEAAEVLGVTVKTVEGRVARAKRQLSQTLDCSLLPGGAHEHEHDVPTKHETWQADY